MNSIFKFYIAVLLVLVLQSTVAFRPFIPLASIQSFQRLHAKATHKITIQVNGEEKVIDCREDTSILEACLDAGIEVPYDCKLGVCLTCPSRLVSGNVDSTGSTLDDSVLEKGYALTCCTWPRSDLVVKIIDEDELVNAQFVKGEKTTY